MSTKEQKRGNKDWCSNELILKEIPLNRSSVWKYNNQCNDTIRRNLTQEAKTNEQKSNQTGSFCWIFVMLHDWTF